LRPYLRKTHHKKRTGIVTQGVGPAFKPQYPPKKTHQPFLNIPVLLNDLGGTPTKIKIDKNT
jgi:hypothetical protein